jgi:hypothetical protein
MPYQIMYASQAAEPMSVAGLEEILVDARAGNQARDVSGALVYYYGVFFQIIEGDEDVVRHLMANIASDTRHHSVKIVYEAEIGQRAFRSWSMAHVSATAEQLSKWAGLPGTATVQELLAEINRVPDRAPRMLVNILAVLAH